MSSVAAKKEEEVLEVRRVTLVDEKDGEFCCVFSKKEVLKVLTPTRAKRSRVSVSPFGVTPLKSQLARVDEAETPLKLKKAAEAPAAPFKVTKEACKSPLGTVCKNLAEAFKEAAMDEKQHLF